MRVVATLTTRSEYHPGLRKTLDSLTKQFDDVYLGLPEKSIKGEIYQPFSHKGVTVVKLKEDIGPSTKLLAGLLMEGRSKNTLIVSVDDDYTYNQNLRKLFEEERLKDIKNNKCRVFSQSGFYIKYWDLSYLGYNGGWHDKSYFFDLSTNPSLTTIAGYAGVAYPAEIFTTVEDYKNFILKYKSDKILFRNDDILISAYISKLNVERVLVNNTIKNLGELNKPDGFNIISPYPTEIYENCYKLKDYLKKTNKFKYYSLTGLDAIIILLSIIILWGLFKKK